MNRILVSLLVTLCLPGFLTVGCSKASKKARHLQRAEAQFEAGDFDRAEIEYLHVLRLDRTNQVALRQLGFMAFEQGRVIRAYALLNDARRADPDNLEVRIKLATMQLAGGQGLEARDEAIWLLTQEPTNEAALMLLVDSSVSTNHLRDAAQQLARLQPVAGQTAGWHLAQGALHLRQRELPAAEAALRQALALDPQSRVAHSLLGNLALLRNDPTNALAAFTAAAADAPWRSPYRIRLADYYANTGDAATARKQLEEIKQKAPDFLPALLRLASLDLAEQRYQEAEANLKLLLLREPAHLEALFLQARLHLAQNQPDKAVLTLERAAKAFPRVPQVHYQMAIARLAQNDLPGAVQGLNEALTLAPDMTEATLLLAELDLRRGNPGAAITSLTRLVGKQPGRVDARLLLAAAHRAARQTEAALKIYDDLSRRFPTNPQPAFLRGLVLGQEGKTAEARRSFEQALQFAPQFTAALEQLVNLDLSEGRFAAAAQRVQAEITREPTNAMPHLLLARVYLAQTNLPAAESTLLRARELNPTSSAVNALLARTYVLGNKHAAALKQFDEIVARNTNDVAAWLQLGLLHSANSNYVAARDAYEKLLQADPNYVPGLNNLAYLYSERLGDLKRAYELGSRARELMPNDPFTADTFGWILYHRKEYPRALVLIQECARQMPDQPEVLYHLGMTHYMLGEEAAARVALQSAVQLAPPDAAWKSPAAERLRILETDPATADAAAVKALERLGASLAEDPILQAKLAAVAERNADWPRAAAGYEKALQQNTNFVPAIVKLAQLYATHLNKPQQAFTLARRARTLEPNDPKIGHTLGRLALDSAQNAADFQWAFGLLQEAARGRADDPEAQWDYARAAFALGQVDTAQATLQKVSTLHPSATRAAAVRDFEAWIALLNRPQEIAANASRITERLKQAPDHVPALLASARLLEQQGKYPEARKAYEQVLKRYPLFTPAHKPLGLLLSDHLNDPAAAYEQATKARTAFPKDPEIARLLGRLSYQRGDFARAVQLLQESAPAFPQDGELLHQLGIAQYRMKQRESKATLTKALSLAPNSPLAAESKQILSELK